MSYPKLGYLFVRHHSTILNSCRNVSARLKKDKWLADKVDDIVRTVDPDRALLQCKYNFVLSGCDINKISSIAKDLMLRATDLDSKAVVINVSFLSGHRQSSMSKTNKRSSSFVGGVL